LKFNKLSGDESLFIYKNITITKSEKGNESVHVYGLIHVYEPFSIDVHLNIWHIFSWLIHFI
jgi:hypothetical protein